MFTLKFCKIEDDADISLVVAADRYEVCKRNTAEHGDVIGVVVYSGKSPEGTQYYVSNNNKDYSTCYIENSAGKTIDNIKPCKPNIKGVENYGKHDII